MEAVGLALDLIHVIYKACDGKIATDSHVKQMIERVISLEQPLQGLFFIFFNFFFLKKKTKNKKQKTKTLR